MLLLDKQEVQYNCEHTALLATKWSRFYVNERQKIRHYCARSTEERKRRIRRIRNVYVNYAIIAMLFTRSIENQP